MYSSPSCSSEAYCGQDRTHEDKGGEEARDKGQGLVQLGFKFHQNSKKTHENWYHEVLGHADYESGFSFLITIIWIFDFVAIKCHRN